MGKQRRSWIVEEKLVIVLAVLSERRSMAEVSRQWGANENQTLIISAKQDSIRLVYSICR
ncbi:MAG: hypothetical protein V9G63_06075 [Candidatus Competibacter sp.]